MTINETAGKPSPDHRPAPNALRAIVATAPKNSHVMVNCTIRYSARAPAMRANQRVLVGPPTTAVLMGPENSTIWPFSPRERAWSGRQDQKEENRHGKPQKADVNDVPVKPLVGRADIAGLIAEAVNDAVDIGPRRGRIERVCGHG